MPIKPFDLTQNSPIELPDELNTVLVDAGLASPKVQDQKDNKVKSAREIFNKAGASIENAADQVANLLTNADTAAGRLKCAELIMKVHGVLQEMEDKPIPQITVNVIGTENKTLINLVLPTV